MSIVNFATLCFLICFSHTIVLAHQANNKVNSVNEILENFEEQDLIPLLGADYKEKITSVFSSMNEEKIEEFKKSLLDLEIEIESLYGKDNFEHEEESVVFEVMDRDYFMEIDIPLKELKYLQDIEDFYIENLDFYLNEETPKKKQTSNEEQNDYEDSDLYEAIEGMTNSSNEMNDIDLEKTANLLAKRLMIKKALQKSKVSYIEEIKM